MGKKPKHGYDEEKFVEYFFALRSLNLLHASLFAKRTIEIPQLFSQEIVKHFLKLEDYDGEGKVFDAKKGDQTYEIKATSSEKGTTTINFSKHANVLVWIWFNLNERKFVIKELSGFDKINNRDELYKCSNSSSTKSKKRETVQLCKVTWDKTTEYAIETCLKQIRR